MDQCIDTPTLADSAFEADLSSFFLLVEKLVEEWNNIFLYIQSMEMRVNLAVWEQQTQIRQKAKAFATPKKSKKIPIKPSSKFSGILKEFRNIKSAVEEDDDPYSVDTRISNLEAQTSLTN